MEHTRRGAGRFQISLLLLWAVPGDSRAEAFNSTVWAGTVLGVPALWSRALSAGARIRRGLDGREGMPTLPRSSPLVLQG